MWGSERRGSKPRPWFERELGKCAGADWAGRILESWLGRWAGLEFLELLGYMALIH